MEAIVDTNMGVTLLGGGEMQASAVRSALSRAPVLVAADGGADRALALGLTPDAVVGDLDSLSAAGRAALPAERVHHVPDQDSTDFDKCLQAVRAPLLLALGFTGARLDHTLASFSTLARFPTRRCVMLGGGDLCFLAPPRLDLTLPPGTRLSLFPMAPVAGRSVGLRWSIDGLRLAPAGVIGTSNETAAPRVALGFDTPGMLVLAPETTLDAVLPALAEAPHWPALS